MLTTGSVSKSFTLTTGGQFESLQGVIPEGMESNQEIDGENCLHFTMIQLT